MRIFKENIQVSALQWLRIVLEALNVPNASKYGLHSLRRGVAQALVQAGGYLATLLQAGGWGSSAFKYYLSMVGVENDAFCNSAALLADIDETTDIQHWGSK